MKSKYIIIEANGIEMPLIFSRFLLHEEIVAAAGKNQVRAAGFCEVDDGGKWLAGGQSVSLALGARPQDAQILNEHTRTKPYLGSVGK